MRKLLAVCFAILMAGGAVRAAEGLDDFVKLVKSGVSEDLQLAYVETLATPFQTSVDDILYLKDLGVSEAVITAIMKQSKMLRDQAAKDSPIAAVEPPVPPPNYKELPLPADPIKPAVPEVADNIKDPLVQDPVVGKPEPELTIKPATLAPEAQPAPERIVTEVAPEQEPRVVEKEIIRERIIERPSTVVYAPQPDQVNVSYFYEALTPYGSWIEIDNEWLWQPTAVITDREWRPYCHRGHWVATNYGWTWYSDYSWGWAPFHYGRWRSHPRYGWVWAPDTVWAPAWVSWRSCDTHHGWAPLPPEARYEVGVGFHYRGKKVSVDFNFGLGERDYCFVPAQRFCEPSLNRYSLPRQQVTNVYNNTTIIQNNYVYNDNRIINNGPPIDRVARDTRREIKPINVVDADIKPGQPIRGSALNDKQLAIYRPKVAAAVPEAPPAVLARREAEIKRKEIARQAADNRKDIRETQKDIRETREAAEKKQRLDAANLHREQITKAAETEKLKNAAKDAEREQERLSKAAEREEDKQKRETIRAAAAEQRNKAEEAKKQLRVAETNEAAVRKAAENAAKEQEREARQAKDAAEEVGRKQAQALKKQQQDAEEAARSAKRQQDLGAEKQKRDAEAGLREQARKDAAARQDAQEVQREQSRRDAAARQDALEVQRKNEAAANAATREKARNEAAARQDALEAQRKAQAAAEAAAREQSQQARRDANNARRDGVQTQRSADTQGPPETPRKDAGTGTGRADAQDMPARSGGPQQSSTTRQADRQAERQAAAEARRQQEADDAARRKADRDARKQ